MMPSFICLAIIFSIVSVSHAVCHSYATRCPATVGQSLVPDESSKEDVFDIPATDALYFTYVVCESNACAEEGSRVLASLFFGNIEIYATIGRKPKISDYDFRTDGIEDVLMLPPMAANSVVEVMVVAITNSKLRAMVSTHSVPSTLALGQPQLDCLMVMPNMAGMSNSAVTHTYQFTPVSTKKLLVSITPFAETDPNLVVTAPVGPSGAPRTWAGSEYGSDTVVLHPEEGDVEQKFSILVSVSPLFNRTQFVLVVTEASMEQPASLLGGVPLEFYAEKDDELHFVLNVPPSPSADITFMATPVFGDPDLYVNPATKGFYSTLNRDEGGAIVPAVWDSAHSFGTDSVLVDHSDPDYVHEGRIVQYFITVRAMVHSRFAVRAYAATSVMTLTAGSPIVDSVSDRSYHYYRFLEDPTRPQDVVFDVSPLQGDPDLLVGCQLLPLFNSSGYPSQRYRHNNYSSSAMGEDSVLVSASPTNPKRCLGGVYYLAVYGFHSTRFSLSATHQGGVVRLQDGVTVRSTAYPNIGRLFSFRVGAEPEELSVSLTPDSSDCDLFVKMNGEASRFIFDYRSILSGVVSDVVVIPERQMCTNCEVSIYVWGRLKCSFSLVAALEDTSIQLSEATPMQESVAEGAVQYYSLLSAQNGTGTVVLTVLAGTPELYVSTSVEKPTSLTANTTVSKLAAGGGLPVVHRTVSEGDTLFIGVGGAGTNASYTVRAHINRPEFEPLLHLLTAVPQADEMRDGGPDWIFYQVNAPIGHESIILRATALVGDVDLYVQHCPFQGVKCYGSEGFSSGSDPEEEVPRTQSFFPNRTFYSATTYGESANFITIDRNDETLTSYIIGVVSNSVNVDYQISMSLKNSILVLTPGVPVTDYTLRGEYDYFSTYVDKSGEIVTFDVTPFSGDVDLFISTSEDVVNDSVDGKPNETFYQWRSVMFGEDMISIDTEQDERACIDCTYYLSVYGYSTSHYSVSVGMESTIGRLLDGVPLQGAVAFLGSTKYTFKNDFGIGRDFKIRLHALTGHPTLFVTLDGSEPNLTNFALSSPLFSTSSLKVSIKHSEEYYEPCVIGGCDIRIAVYGVLSSTYTLSITSSLANTLLQMDVPVSAEVGSHQYDYFKTTLPSSSSNLRLTLTEFSGFAIMFVSCHHSFPNETGVGFGGWHFYPYETDHLDITALEATEHNCPATGDFFVSVYGEGSCSYSLMASVITNTSVPRLYVGTAMSRAVGYQAFDYFYYSPSTDFAQNLNILVTTVSGDVDVFVSDSWANRPYYSEATSGVRSYSMRSAPIGGGGIAIRHTQLEELCLENTRKDQAAGRLNVEACYIIVGVFGAYSSADETPGSGTSDSSYRIEISTEDSTTTLSSGVAIRSSLLRHTIDYYKYSITTPDTDVIVSNTPFFGDPDVFMAFSPVVHPNPNNYTWLSANYGADTLTLQADEIAKHCVPVTEEGVQCELFIGVYAWKNTSYSLVVRMEEGSKHPVVLTDGQAQSGAVEKGFYSYYSYFVKSRQDQDPDMMESVTISVTGRDGSDQDMYVIFGDSSEEPGQSNFQYMSANYAGLVDQVSVSSSDEHFCHDCTVTIAVYGYLAGEFSIVATSGGVTELLSGHAVAGHLEDHAYQYYSFHNTDPDAQIDISLTAISGDADLVMNVFRHSSDAEDGDTAGEAAPPYQYPTMFSSTWHSINAGSDGISLNYADPHFCYECSYVIGVYSYRNSTYTLLMTDSTEAEISLSRNRPQLVSMQQDGERLFTARSASSTEDITVSVTTLGSGTVKIYMQKYPSSSFNAETMQPNPLDPSTFAYSNIHSNDDFVHAPGPNAVDMVYVILVTASAPVQYNVVLSSSDTPLLLRAGIPQSHFVKKRTMEFFKFPLPALTDLQISISATSGDPDLFISLGGFYPQCTPSASGFSIYCQNWTWSSTSYVTDQVIISQDYPCDAVMPGTHVSGDCQPRDFHAGEVHIGVYGYSDSKFHVMVTPRGQHIQLLPGHRQLAYTAPGFLCAVRTDNGACVTSGSGRAGDDRDLVAVEVAYFKFEFSGSVNSQSVLFTVVPTCAVDRNTSAPCQPGCDCALLEMVIGSCVSQECTSANRFPSSLSTNSYKALRQVTREGTSILVDDKSKAHCKTSANSEDVCIYYVAVISHQATSSVAFTVDVETSNDLSVIACQTTPSPDGRRISHSSTMSTHHNDAKFFELCSGAGSSSSSQERMLVTLEECHGSAEMYACSDASSSGVCDNFLPTEKSWEYYANDHETCDHSSHGRKTCTSNVDTVSTRIPTFDFPEKNGNYYVKVNGTGQFNLNIQNTIGGELVSPRLMFDSVDQSHQDGVKMSISHSHVDLSWKHAQILIPGAATYAQTAHMVYSLYTFPSVDTKRSKDFIFDTPCGLEYSVKKLKGFVRPVEVHSATSDVQYTLDTEDYPPRTELVLVVMASCDSECLRQVSKVTQKATMTCDAEVGCKSQHLIYQSVLFTTGGPAGGGDDAGSTLAYMFFVSILVITAVAATLFGVFSFYCKNKQQLDELQALEMSDFSDGGEGGMADNIKVAGEFSQRGGSSRGPGSSSGPRAGGDLLGLMREGLSSGLSSLVGALMTLTASSPSSSRGDFAPLESSSSHGSLDTSVEDAYDPPVLPLLSTGQGSSYTATPRSSSNYEEEEEDDITISL